MRAQNAISHAVYLAVFAGIYPKIMQLLIALCISPSATSAWSRPRQTLCRAKADQPAQCAFAAPTGKAQHRIFEKFLQMT
jgi:hypothetical protein